MRIGITFDLKDHQFSGGLPEDWQEEFDSPQTIEAIAAVLRQLGHEVTLLGDGPMLVSRLLADPPDFVFNFAEGQGVSRCREAVGSSRVDLQACKLEYSIVSPK